MGFRRLTLYENPHTHILFPDKLNEGNPIDDDLISVIGGAKDRIDVIYDTDSDYRFLPSNSISSGTERVSQTHLAQLRNLITTIDERDYESVIIGPRDPLIMVPQGDVEPNQILLAYARGGSNTHQISISPGSSYQFISPSTLAEKPSKLRDMINTRISRLKVDKPRI